MPEKELTLRIGRREFSRQAVVAILSAATITIVDCGGGGSSPAPTPTPPPGGGGGGGGGGDVAGVVSANHGHTAVVTAAEITAANAVNLDIHALAFLIELEGLKGRQQLAGENVHAILRY